MDPEWQKKLQAWLALQGLNAQKGMGQLGQGLGNLARGTHALSQDLREFAAPRIQETIRNAGANREHARIAGPMNVGIQVGDRPAARADFSSELNAEVPFRSVRAGDQAVSQYNDILNGFGINPATLRGYPESQMDKPSILYSDPSPEIPYPQHVGGSPGMGLTSFKPAPETILASLGAAPEAPADSGWIRS